MNQPSCPEGILYTIRAGDTLFSLSRRWYNSWALAGNKSGNPNNLQIGQVICIPAEIAAGCPGFFYTIAPGDTLFSIAKRFGTSVEFIEFFNPGIDPYNLQMLS